VQLLSDVAFLLFIVIAVIRIFFSYLLFWFTANYNIYFYLCLFLFVKYIKSGTEVAIKRITATHTNSTVVEEFQLETTVMW
jgi:hypothetical protein